MGYSGRGANAFAKAALDPHRSSRITRARHSALGRSATRLDVPCTLDVPSTKVGRRGEAPLVLLAEDFHYRVSPRSTTTKLAARPTKPRRRRVRIAGHAGHHHCDHQSSYHLP